MSVQSSFTSSGTFSYVVISSERPTIAFKGVEGQTINLKNLGNTEQDYIICYLTIYK